MSQVRNLRAMFENKGDTSPPERGRSPAVTSTGTESPRPLSKVATSFVAIEKDGRIGLRRDQSQDSGASVSTRKLSGELESSSPPAAQLRPSPLADKVDKPPTKPEIKDQKATERPQPPITPGQTPSLSPVTTTTASVKEKSPPLSPEEKIVPVSKGTGPKVAPATQTAQAPTPSSSSSARSNGTSKPPADDSGAGKAKSEAASKHLSITAADAPTKAATKSVPQASTKLATTKPAKSPTVAKAPKSPNVPNVAKAPKSPAIAAPKGQSKSPDKRTAKNEKPAAPKTSTSTTTTKPPATSSVQKPPPRASPPANTGFVKPRVKSPTRPINLPPSLTTHTASSGSKLNVPRQSLSRAGGSYKASDSHARPPSRTTGSAAAAAPTRNGGRTLRRQSSTVGRPRPSFGPPPKQPARDHPPTKKEKQVDESFLARMMRPTQASSSKTVDRTPSTTPPRRPISSVTPKKAASGRDSKAIRRPAARPSTRTPTSARATPQPSIRGATPATNKSSPSNAPTTDPSATSEPAVPAVEEFILPTGSPRAIEGLGDPPKTPEAQTVVTERDVGALPPLDETNSSPAQAGSAQADPVQEQTELEGGDDPSTITEDSAPVSTEPVDSAESKTKPLVSSVSLDDSSVPANGGTVKLVLDAEGNFVPDDGTDAAA